MSKKNIIDKVKETETRWVTFLTKLEDRMQELCNAAIPELQEAYKSDNDEHRRAYYHLLSIFQSQIDNMTDKASKAYHKNIRNFFDDIEDEVDDLEDSELIEFVNDASSRCDDLSSKFDDLSSDWRDKLEETTNEDLEGAYQAILDEFEELKDKFCCQQCGSPILLPKLLFMITYIHCPACQTQNTFKPSTKAAGLEHLGRALAEQRTNHLLKIYEAENNKEREIYDQMHELEMSILLVEDEKVKAPVEAQIAALEQERRESVRKAPQLYKKYMRAMFDEWNKIVPDLKDQNERVYESWVKETTSLGRLN